MSASDSADRLKLRLEQRIAKTQKMLESCQLVIKQSQQTIDQSQQLIDAFYKRGGGA
jgi:uncharacterized coiled-coil protein SlyX